MSKTYATGWLSTSKIIPSKTRGGDLWSNGRMTGQNVPALVQSREIRLNGSLGFLQVDIGLAKLRKTKKEERR
jgi:hypothetical protein